MLKMVVDDADRGNLAQHQGAALQAVQLLLGHLRR